MKSRWLMIALFAVVLQALPVAGQVLPLHRAAAPGGVVPASCNSCLSGHGGAVMADSGTVWGTSCDPCPGDLDDTDTVDAEDLAAVLFAWGTDGGKTPQADITGDGTVDASDLAVVLGSWGACP